MTPEAFTALMNELRGGIDLREALFLGSLAAQVAEGCIVEIGSYRGKSAVALARGAKLRTGTSACPIYCIEPHEVFTGYYGGKFGPDDRCHFFRTLLQAGCCNQVALINLKSEEAAAGWNKPIGLLFIDGDHRAESVLRDFFLWSPHVVANGFIAFDDATDPQCGPSKVIDLIRRSSEFEEYGSEGKIVAFRKKSNAHYSKKEFRRRRIAVGCDTLVLSGGMLRMERLGSKLVDWGHDVCYVRISAQASAQYPTRLPILPLDEASLQIWDCVIIPGAGFPHETIEAFAAFRQPQFGTRVQFVLNDRSRKEAFLAVNASFRPDIVIFNNRDWTPGTFIEFDARRFHILEGAVDITAFAPLPYRKFPCHSDRIVIGGLASKNPAPLLAALRLLPKHFSLRLFGPDPYGLAESYKDLIDTGRLELVGILHGRMLYDFYASVDLVCMSELFAGWSNLVAEAMACGLPVICTPHGTGAIARSGETAIVLEHPTPERFAEAICALALNPALAVQLGRAARRAVEAFSWDRYAQELLELVELDTTAHYYFAPELGLHGKWPISSRIEGLHELFASCSGKSVLDVGCAEGAIAHLFAANGASLVHGVDVDPIRVEKAIKNGRGFHQAEFCVADASDWQSFRARHADWLQAQYDIVLYLGLHHHLPKTSRRQVLEALLGLAREACVIRMPESLWIQEELESLVERAGFSVVNRLVSSLQAQGMLFDCRRIQFPGKRS